MFLEIPILRKVEKANDIFKRHLCKLSQDKQDNWFKVLPIPLMRALSAPQNGIISMTDLFFFVHRYCHRSGSLSINYVTQLSAFQLPYQLKTAHGGFLHFKEKTFFNSANTFTNNNHMWHLFRHLTILKWTGITYCAYTMDIMCLLILIMF